MLPPNSATNGALAEAFDAFVATAGRMETSYSQLQGEIARLRRELEERNAALTSSLSENKNIRAALTRILDALPCGVIAIDANDGIVLMNPEASRLLAVAPDSVSQVQDFPAPVQGLLKAAIARDDEHEVTLEAKTTARCLSIRRTALHIESSQDSKLGPRRFVLILRDVTARKETETQREASRNMLALGEMAAVWRTKYVTR